MQPKSRAVTTLSLLIAIALLAAGCGATAAPAEPTTAPAGPTAEEGQGVLPTVELGGSNPAGARDVVLAFLAQRYGAEAPAAGLAWQEKDVTAEGLMGGSTFEYMADDWKITISYPIVAPQSTIYRTVVENPATGFGWEGRVDAWGSVSEGPEEVLNARDMALGAIARQYAIEMPPAELSWTGGRTTPEGLVGSETYEYTAGDWKVVITYPVTSPEQQVYTIQVTNDKQSFQWQGELDAAGNLTTK